MDIVGRFKELAKKEQEQGLLKIVQRLPLIDPKQILPTEYTLPKDFRLENPILRRVKLANEVEEDTIDCCPSCGL